MQVPGHRITLILNSQSLLGEPKITISAEHNLKEVYKQEIGLKMLEMAISETPIFKIFWGSMPPHPPSPRPTPFENQRSARATHLCIHPCELVWQM